jgi:glycosyltransferase involved in cell wall biosynthesis
MPPVTWLRIGIDAHAIGERRTGNERFMANLVPALLEMPEHDFVLYFTQATAAASWSSDRSTTRILRPSHPVARIPFVLPWHAWRDRLDVLLVQYTGPPVRSCPVVTVVHDVAFALYPKFYAPLERLWMRRTIPWTMRTAAEVVTVSEFSRQEILRLYPIDPSKVSVAIEAVDPIFLDLTPRSSPVDPPFFLAIGNLQPRKNLVTLIRAYRRLLAERPEVPERLVIVGQEWFGAGELYRETESLEPGRIVFTGYVPDQDLVGLLQRATAFCYPSIYEGFGLPPLEAMAAGAPTMVSDIPVMREIAGDGALRFPATDTAAWAEGLARVAFDPMVRADLTRRGRKHAGGFSWNRCARSVLDALERAATGPRTSR